MLRVLSLFIAQLLLWTLFAVLNHYLATWQVTVHASAVFVVYAGLWLGPREGLWASLLSGLLMDAGSPTPFGQQALLHGILFTILLLYRSRLAQHETAVQILVALICTLLLYLVRHIINYGTLVEVGTSWGRLIWDLLLSLLLVGLCSPWLLALQAAAVSLATPGGFERPEPEE